MGERMVGGKGSVPHTSYCARTTHPTQIMAVATLWGVRPPSPLTGLQACASVASQACEKVVTDRGGEAGGSQLSGYLHGSGIHVHVSVAYSTIHGAVIWVPAR